MIKQEAPLELVQLTRRRGMSDSAFERLMELLAERREPLPGGDALIGSYAETVVESLFASEYPAAPDCLECGACCSYFHRIPVRLTDPTPRLLTWMVWEAGAVSGPKLLWLRREPQAGHCVAFEGRVGERAFCAVYELRPDSCRAFEAGSDRCRAVRRLYGLEPRLSGPEQSRRARFLAGRADEGEYAGEAGLEDAAPALSDEAGKLKFLRELIDFSSEKLEIILAESKRVLEFLDAQGIIEGAARCRRVVEAIEADAKAVAAEHARTSIWANPETLEPGPAEDLLRERLKAGLVSHEALERASKRLIDLGGVAFEASGMRARLKEPL
ncbi:MAG TPA: YkgJ family cysteine cluster protein [Blastocatellia bacterium]|jgi:Fe-S-cluster containining protein|nr:YkgJ family cysteine cluster protein [Blastocatellia bacterium]